jgi:hypothetical protein
MVEIIEFPCKPRSCLSCLQAGADGLFILLSDENGVPQKALGPFPDASSARAFASENAGGARVDWESFPSEGWS